MLIIIYIFAGLGIACAVTAAVYVIGELFKRKQFFDWKSN